MLSIGKLVACQEAYYDQQVAQGRDDYYEGKGEASSHVRGGGVIVEGGIDRCPAISVSNCMNQLASRRGARNRP